MCLAARAPVMAQLRQRLPGQSRQSRSWALLSALRGERPAMLEFRVHQHAAFWVSAVVACGVVVGMAVHGKLHVQMSHLFVPPVCPAFLSISTECE